MYLEFLILACTIYILAPYHVMRYGECYVALRSQRTNHVLHYEYTSTGENLPFLEEEYEIATENGVFQMNGRWSDNPIVL